MTTKMTQVKLGDTLKVVDSGFDCMKQDEVKVVMQNEKGELYVECSEGEHYIDGQKDTHGNLIGLELV
jgi:hypothetical protein